MGDPYADLMTLLLAFFVVMYAISSVNEGKYRIMADALTDAFGGAPRTINPVQVGNKQVQGGGWDSPSVIKSGTKIGPSAPAPSHDPTLLPSMASQMRMPVSVHNQEQIARAERQLNSIADRLTAALAPLIDRGMISVRRTELWIEVEINSDILFPTGSAALDMHARQTLASLAEVLRDVPNSVRVEGHTDNVPIATATFPPTGSCRPDARPASCTCSPTRACSRRGWRWSAMASSVRAKRTTAHRGATATAG